MAPKKGKLYLQNAIFMGVAHIIAFYGFYTLILGHWKWQTIASGVVWFFISGLGITVGYHRFFTHRSFKCGKVVQTILAICGTTAIENTIKVWVSGHVIHHQKTDKDEDPYNAARGFWHSHIGWILFKDPDRKKGDFSAADHLTEDSWTAQLVNFQHKNYYLLIIFFWGIMPVLIASLWGDPLGGFISRVSASILVWHATFFINSLAHMRHWGSSQPYTRANSSQDSWIVSLVTFGEGYHNYHHAFPRDFRNGLLWYNFDPSKWIILGLSKLGLATDLKRTPDDKIEKARKTVLEQA